MNFDRQLAEYRDFVLGTSEMVAAGIRPGGLIEIVRDHMEAVICLADEAPEARQAECQYLIERFEALVKHLSH